MTSVEEEKIISLIRLILLCNNYLISRPNNSRLVTGMIMVTIKNRVVRII